MYNTAIFFSRVLHLNSTYKIKINDLFPYELVPIPIVLFKGNCEERYPKSKADLKNAIM